MKHRSETDRGGELVDLGALDLELLAQVLDLGGEGVDYAVRLVAHL